MPAVQPTYASGAIRRSVKSRGAFAEVTADCVCALPAVADPGNGAALVDICNRRELLLPGGFDRRCTVPRMQTERLGSPVPGSTSLPRVKLPREEPTGADVPQSYQIQEMEPKKPTLFRT